jgi:FkbM family methyltransferase
MPESTLVSQLETLLSESVREATVREATAFDEAVPPGIPIVLFGAGNLGKRALHGLNSLGTPPVAFADNNNHLWGTTIEGIPVLAPTEAVARFPTAAFIVTIWTGEGWDRMGQRCAQLQVLGCSCVIPFGLLFWKHPDIFLPHYAMDLPHRVLEDAETVRTVFDLWEDENSRREYVAQVRWRLHHDFDALPDPVKTEIYFPDDIFLTRDDEVFVDCGAFDGDTLRRFLHHRQGRFQSILAFEPDPKNFDKLEKFVAGLPRQQSRRIKLYQQAVGARREFVSFDAMGSSASYVGTGPINVESVPLDEICQDISPTYLKMDTEGSEPEALIGSRRILEQVAPALAISSYHRQDHLWRIPTSIRAAYDQYSYFLRPQCLDGWDLVCYAVPRARLAN